MDELVEDLTPDGLAKDARIFFSEVLEGYARPTFDCYACNCMLDPELRQSSANKSRNNDEEDRMADQNQTTWPINGENDNNNSHPYGVIIQRSRNNLNRVRAGIHTDADKATCHLLAKNHNKNSSGACIGLQHGKSDEQQRYKLEGGNRVLREKCNDVLKHIWCEQQTHGLTNLCYFISEVEKICFDALGIPCVQIYGWLDRGSNSFTHAWVKLGEQKQLIDITFYREKSRSFPGGYWLSLGEYQEGSVPNTMENDTLFKKENHWRYVYLCTLVEERRNFLRCMFKYMTDEMQVRLPDVFKDARSTCWNCNSHLETSKTVTCSDCASAVFCSESCLREESNKTPSHLEICADYKKRQNANTLTLTKPPVASMAELLNGKFYS